jgi:drug/metabolite transporter, DME family
LLAILCAALLWSLTACVVKSPIVQNLPPDVRGPMLACGRALLAAAVMAPFVPWQRACWNWSVLGLLVCFAAMNTLYISAITLTTAAAAIFLQYTSIVWISLGGWLWQRETLDGYRIAALVCGLVGIFTMVMDSLSSQYLMGNLLALGSGISYAGVVLCLRVLRNESTMWLIFLAHLVSGIVLLPTMGHALAVAEPTHWFVMAFLGTALMAAPYLLFAYGVRYVSASEAALLPLLEPILSPVWVWLAWKEVPPTGTWIAGGLILLGLILQRWPMLRDRAISRPAA